MHGGEGARDTHSYTYIYVCVCVCVFLRAASDERRVQEKRLAKKGKPVAIFLTPARRVMEYIFALFSLLFFFLSSPPRPSPSPAQRHRRLFFSQRSGRSSFHRALSGTLNRPRAARNENEPQKSFVRASVTFDIPAFFHVVTFFSSSSSSP